MLILHGMLGSRRTWEGVFDPQRPIDVAAAVSRPGDAVTHPADLGQPAVVSPHATAHTVDGAGHLIHEPMSHRDEFFVIVERLLDSPARCPGYEISTGV